jgi:hypothetical protein
LRKRLLAQTAGIGQKAGMHRFLVLAAAMVVACSHDDDDHTHTERPAVCEAIGTMCHPFDNGSGVAHDCHELSHATWTAAQCEAEKAKCTAACTAMDSGTDTAADTSATDSAPGETATDASDAG